MPQKGIAPMSDIDKLNQMLAQCSANGKILAELAKSDDYYVRLWALRAEMSMQQSFKSITDLLETLEQKQP